jgi:hypothetical protein
MAFFNTADLLHNRPGAVQPPPGPSNPGGPRPTRSDAGACRRFAAFPEQASGAAMLE